MIWLIWYDMIWLIWYDMIWLIWYDIWYDMVWYDMIWYDMIWYDMIWYDMIWRHSVCYVHAYQHYLLLPSSGNKKWWQLGKDAYWGKGKVGAGPVNQRMGSDLKRLGVAELAYPKVGRKGELAVLSAVILTIDIILLYVCAPSPKVYTAS